MQATTFDKIYALGTLLNNSTITANKALTKKIVKQLETAVDELSKPHNIVTGTLVVGETNG